MQTRHRDRRLSREERREERQAGRSPERRRRPRRQDDGGGYQGNRRREEEPPREVRRVGVRREEPKETRGRHEEPRHGESSNNYRHREEPKGERRRYEAARRVEPSDSRRRREQPKEERRLQEEPPREKKSSTRTTHDETRHANRSPPKIPENLTALDDRTERREVRRRRAVADHNDYERRLLDAERKELARQDKILAKKEHREAELRRKGKDDATLNNFDYRLPKTVLGRTTNLRYNAPIPNAIVAPGKIVPEIQKTAAYYDVILPGRCATDTYIEPPVDGTGTRLFSARNAPGGELLVNWELPEGYSLEGFEKMEIGMDIHKVRWSLTVRFYKCPPKKEVVKKIVKESAKKVGKAVCKGLIGADGV